MRVLIADDNREIRAALTLVLQELWPDCEVAEAGHESQVLDYLSSRPADIVLLDWDLDGRAAARIVGHIRAHQPAAAVVAMSSHPEARDDSLAAGATAFVGTSDPPEWLFGLLTRLGEDL